MVAVPFFVVVLTLGLIVPWVPVWLTSAPVHPVAL